MVRYAHPVAQTNSSGGTYLGGSADYTNLVDNDNATYWYGANNQTNFVEFRLTDFSSAPPAYGFIALGMVYSVSDDDASPIAPQTSGSGPTVTVDLYQGTTLLDTWGSFVPDASTWKTENYVINYAWFTQGITDWSDVRVRITSNGSGGSPSNRRGIAVSKVNYEIPDAATAPSWKSQDFRFYNDDGTWDTMTAIAGENVAITRDAGATVILIANVGEISGTAGPPTTGYFRLQYRINAGAWTDVGTATDVRYTASANIADGTNDTSPLVGGVSGPGGVFLNGAWNEFHSTTTVFTDRVWDERSTEYGHCLNLFNVSGGDVIQFRYTDPVNQQALGTQTNVPQITVNAAGIIGTLTKTLDAATTSADADVLVSGRTGSAVTADTTAVRADTTAVTADGAGNDSIFLDAATLDAAATVDVVASLSKTLDNATLDSAGTVATAGVIGTLDVTLADASTGGAAKALSASGDRLARTTGTLPTSSAMTVAGWVRRTADTNTFSAIALALGADGYAYIGTASDGTTLEFISTGGSITSTELPANEWVYVAMTRTASVSSLYRGTEAAQATLVNTDTWATVGNDFSLYLLNNDTQTQEFQGDAAFFRVWDTDLTLTELRAEQYSATPVKTANLIADLPLQNASTPGDDQSAVNEDFTVIGTLTETTGPDISIGGAAEGEVLVSGALDVTLDSATVSSAAAVGIVTTADITLADATLESAGTVDVTAALSKTLDDATLDGVGTTAFPGIDGALNVQLEDASLSAAGAVEVSAVADVLLADAALSGAATVDVSGAASIQLDAATLSSDRKSVV